MDVKTLDGSTDSIFRSYLIFGPTKTGKTRLATTLPKESTLIVNVENNLDSIDGSGMMVVDCFTKEQWQDIVESIKTQPPEWLFVDSLSALLQKIFNEEFKKTKDGRVAYNAVERAYYDLVGDLKGLKCNIVCIGQRGQIKDEITGGLVFGASLPWAKLEQMLPYNFSAVMAARNEKDEEGNTHYFLQCHPDTQYQVGARTAFGKDNPLEFYEAPDLMAIHNKLTNKGD
jgi:hypothetical protein